MTYKICLLSILFGTSLAWDNQGHRIIALIAGKYVKDRTASFLIEHLDDAEYRGISEGLAYISIQADMKQNDPKFAWASPMHYAYTTEQCSPYEEARDCPNRVCIVTAIAKFSAILSDPKTTTAARKEALMFLVHFMGDIHQPLHVGFWKDDGGSKLWLADPSTHLHDVWDSVIVTEFLDREASKNLKRKWNYYSLAEDILQEMAIALPERKTALSIAVPSDTSNYQAMNDYAARVATETTGQYTCKFAYRNERGRLIQPYDMLTKTYMEERWKVVKNQYKVAGYRLALVLDNIAETFWQKSKAQIQVAHAKTLWAKSKEKIQVVANNNVVKQTTRAVQKPSSNRFSGLYISSESEEPSDVDGSTTDEDDDDKTVEVFSLRESTKV
jgi:hypothetical protein